MIVVVVGVFSERGSSALIAVSIAFTWTRFSGGRKRGLRGLRLRGVRFCLVLWLRWTVELGRFRRRFWNSTMYFKVPLCKVYLSCLHINDSTVIIHGWHVYDSIVSCQSSDVSWRFPGPFSELNIDHSHGIALGLGPLHNLLNSEGLIVSFSRKFCSSSQIVFRQNRQIRRYQTTFWIVLRWW